jgi:hypothetical protein
MRFKPTTMLRGRKARSAIAAASVLAAVGGVAFAQAAPAKADPQTTLVAVGSDTIQDVWNAFTNGTPAGPGGTPAAVTAPLAPGLVASYNATNPATGALHEIITPQDGWAVQNGIVPNPTATFPLPAGDCSFARPNGSGEGRDNLRKSLNQSSTTGGKAVAPFAPLGCVDIARSSSTVDVTDNVPANDIQWVPFAIDAVTGVTGPASCTPAGACPGFVADLGNGTTQNVTTVASTLGPDIGTATQTQLNSLYNCHRTLIGSTEYFPIGSTTDTEQPGDVGIDMYVPQSGSGTRSFWESAIGFSDSEVDNTAGTCVHDYIVGGVLAFNATTQPVKVTVEEHDGTAVSTDPIGYGPFSIAQYISQQNPTHNPRFHGAVLQDINGISPTTGSGSTLAINLGNPTATPPLPAFPILRNVYDIVKLTRLNSTSDPIHTLFSGIGSKICSQKSIIQSYGFALMSASAFNGLTCGAISSTAPNNLEGAP